MSKRIIKDPLTKADLEIKRTPQPRRGKGRDAKNRNFYQRNYLDVFKIITPNVYWDDDQSLSGVEVAELDQLINGNILATSVSGAVNASSLSGVNYLSSLSSVSGISKYFVKQNNPMWLTPQDFENKLLVPLYAKAKEDVTYSSVITKTLDTFETSAEFITFVSDVFLPSSHLHQTSSVAARNLATESLSAYSNTPSGTHKYYLDNLSWLYLLNRADPAGPNVRPTGYATSAEVAKLYTDKIWNGQTISLEDCMKVYQKYIWGNYAYFSSFDERIIPEKYRFPASSHEFTSGVLLRDRLETLSKIVYSDADMNNKDNKVENAFIDYTAATSLITSEEYAGPFTRFMKALGFSFADRSGEAEELETLLDIESCPDEYLEHLADLIGWTLIGPDASRRRNQIRQAVAIYKAKGTKRSVQFVSDAVFGTSAFNVVDNQLFDLWESYVPHLIFYSLMTKSSLTTDGLKSFTRQKADDLGLDSYSRTNLDHNVRVAVDRIMWELIVEFPNNFTLGGHPFGRTSLYEAYSVRSTGYVEPDFTKPYTGDWVLYPNGYYFTAPGPNESGGNIPHLGAAPPVFDPGTNTIVNWTLGSSFLLAIGAEDPKFSFYYRERTMPFPPWEELKYYQESSLSTKVIQALKFKLLCFGVSPAFVDQVITYIEDNTSKKIETDFLTNNLLFFTNKEQTPPNYSEIVSVENPLGNELIKYLPYWNSKSSHFKIKYSSSSFDFVSKDLDVNTTYALSKLKTLVNTTAPAHAIPEIILDLSAHDDPRMELSAAACPKARLSLSSVATDGSALGDAASSTILVNFAASTVNPVVVLPAAKLKKFRRSDVSGLDNVMFASGTSATYNDTSTFFSAASRSSIRRRNSKYLLNHEEIDLRDGIGSPGFNFLYIPEQLSAIYAAGDTGRTLLASSGVLSLGFVPSALNYKAIPLTSEPWGFGNLLDRALFPEVWERCQNYNSSDKFFDIQVSSTFPYRGYASPESDECSAFFSRREPLTDLLALMHRVSYYEKKLEASSLVSGYYLDNGQINPAWATSSSKIAPVAFSSWYEYGFRDVITSLANQLEESEIANTDINYLEDFRFGEKLNRLYKEWLSNYGRQSLNFNYTKNVSYNPHILSHIFGPYLFNHDFEHTASALTANPELITSSVSSLVDLSYSQGAGVLSFNNIQGVFNYAATAATDMYVSIEEVRNDNILSGVELVDSSTTYTDLDISGIPKLPTFSVLRIDDVKNLPQSQLTLPDSLNRTLEDNTLIRHTRNSSITLPRLRYKIDPATTRPEFKNLLTPQSEYSLKVETANLNLNNEIVPTVLKAWIHTEPISYTYRNSAGEYVTENSIWSYSNNYWVRTPLTNLTSQEGIDYVSRISPGNRYGESAFITEQVIGRTVQGVFSDILPPTAYPPFRPRNVCRDLVVDINIPTQAAISEVLFDNMEFNFNTRNEFVRESQNSVQVHNKDRVYYIELFLDTSDKEAYSLFNTVQIENKTLKDKSVIGTNFGEYPLDRKELKACLDYFASLSLSNLASRDVTITSGALEVSGGGRLSYRQNLNRSYPAWGSNNQVTGITILGP